MDAWKKSVLGLSLLLAAAAAFGADWTTKQLTNTTGNIAAKRIAVNNANVYVVWTDDAAGPTELYFRKSGDSGKSWKTPKRLSAAGEYAFSPDVAVNGSNVYVVWEQNSALYFRKSANGGGKWKPAVKIAAPELYPKNIRIAVSGLNIYVVWDQADTEIPGVNLVFIMKSANRGKTWGTPVALTERTAENSYPDVAASGANVYVVWQRNPSLGDIFFRRSADAGKTWQAEVNLSDTPTVESRDPGVEAQGSLVYVVWDEETYYQGIYFRRSSNSGVTWPTATRLTTDAETPGGPDIAAKNANVGVAYFYLADTDTEAYLRTSVNSGAGWNLTRLTNNSGGSIFPSAAYSKTKIYVAYLDDSTGNLQLYVMFSPL